MITSSLPCDAHVSTDPLWSLQIEGQDALDKTTNEAWVSGRTVDEAMEMAVERFKVDKSKITLTQVRPACLNSI